MTKHAPTIAAGASGALVIPLAAAIRLGLSPLVLTRLAILGAALGQLALVDVQERRIPNRIVLKRALLRLMRGVEVGVSGFRQRPGVFSVCMRGDELCRYLRSWMV